MYVHYYANKGKISSYIYCKQLKKAPASSFFPFCFPLTLSLSLLLPSSIRHSFHQPLVCHAAGAPNLSRVRVRGHCDSEHWSVSSITLSPSPPHSLTGRRSEGSRRLMEIFSEYLTFSAPDECQGCFVSFTIKKKKKLHAVFPGAVVDIKTQAKSLPGMRGE